MPALSVEVIVGTIITIVLAICSAFWALVWMIRRGDLKRVTDLEDSVKKLQDRERDIASIEEQIKSLQKMEDFLNDLHTDLENMKRELAKEKEDGAVSTKSIMYLENNLERVMKALEKMREDLKDALVTISGFGRDYITRKEFYESHKRSLHVTEPGEKNES